MPYRPAHKIAVRARIVEAARMLFNRHGFSEVSIDQVMAEVGLTRGGFYNHFRTKDELYAEAVSSFLEGRGKTWRDEAGIGVIDAGPDTVRAMVQSYLSSAHLGDLEGQCPMIALTSDVARAGPAVRQSYETLLRAMVFLFEHNSAGDRHTALALSALCVGGMVLSRSIDDPALAEEIRSAALALTEQLNGLAQ